MKKLRFKDLDGNAVSRDVSTFQESVLSANDTKVREVMTFRVIFSNEDGSITSYPVNSDTNTNIIKAYQKYAAKFG